MTIAQIVYDNELHFGLSDEDIREKVMVYLFRRTKCRCLKSYTVAPENMGCHGRLYTNGGLLLRGKTSWSFGPQAACTYAVQATYERVCKQ